jgi:amino acid transporter
MRKLFHRLRRTILGPPRNPFDPAIRERIALVAFFAWIGLGADGLSSANYGPELGFLALGDHPGLGIYLALLTGVTVFVIAFGYNQVVQLFPTGGGGYRVSSSLLGPFPGVLAGVCLLVDYVLTIAISIASAVDALFSLLPIEWQFLKIPCGAGLIFFLVALNLRGMKESIAILMPIFIIFLVTHIALIIYGIAVHVPAIPELLRETSFDTRRMAETSGGWAIFATLLLAYSLGGGTYTGLEAVSNNVHTLAEPRVRTGKVTMMYMAASLSAVATGIILLYLLWHAHPVEGQTLNAVVFRVIAESWFGPTVGGVLVTVVLVAEAGLLFVAANTGFLGGPAVLANMAADEWVPHQARYLSSRLVTRNGIVLMGLAAVAVLVLAQGQVGLLVVLYSITVFGAFALTLLGMSTYWVRMRGHEKHWLRQLILAGIGFLVCAGILAAIVIARFAAGGWVTILIVGALIWICYSIKRHYGETRSRLERADRVFARRVVEKAKPPPPLDAKAPTAIFLVGGSLGSGMHSLLWVRRLFPGQFRNFLFVRAGEVDTQSFGGEERLHHLTEEVDTSLHYYVAYCHAHDLAAASHRCFGTDVVRELTELVETLVEKFPNAIVFASKLIFEDDRLLPRLLHNQTALTMQRQLHLRGVQMVVLPMILHAGSETPQPGKKRRSFHWRRPDAEPVAEAIAEPAKLSE